MYFIAFVTDILYWMFLFLFDFCERCKSDDDGSGGNGSGMFDGEGVGNHKDDEKILYRLLFNYSDRMLSLLINILKQDRWTGSQKDG